MMINNDNFGIQRLLIAAHENRREIERIFQSNALFAPPYFEFSSRVKTSTRALNKLHKIRKNEKPDASASDVPDILGLRFVSLFQSNVVEALRIILDILVPPDQKDLKGAVPTAAKPQIIIYTARPEADPFSIVHPFKELVDKLPYIKDLIYTDDEVNNKNNISIINNTLYSSIHIRTGYQVNTEFDGTRGSCLLPIEIQVRTVLEDYWGKISHITSWSEDETSRSQSVKNHLNALKQLVDGCALYAALIKDDFEIHKSMLSDTNEKPRPISTTGSSILNSLPENLMFLFNEAIQKQKNIAGRDEAIYGIDFIEVAQDFKLVEDHVKQMNIDSILRNEIMYTVQIERAFCLLYSNEMNCIEEAYEIYSNIMQIKPNDVVCQLRLAQALRRKNEYMQAKELLLKSVSILETVPNIKDGIPLWVFSAIHRELAGAYWKIAISSNGMDQDAAFISAINELQIALKLCEPNDQMERIGILNNILYFAWEHINISENSAGSKISKKPLTKTEISKILKTISIDEVSKHIQSHKQDLVYDTITRVNLYLGHHRQAKISARLTVDVLLSKVRDRKKLKTNQPEWLLIKDALSDDELDTLNYAYSVLAK